MSKDKSSGKYILEKVFDLAGYAILVTLLIFLILGQLFPSMKGILDEQFLQIGLLTGLLAFLYYFDKRISYSEKNSKAIHKGFAELKSEVIQPSNIENLFEIAMPTSNHVNELRIFALNTDKIYKAFNESDRHFRVDKIYLLIHPSEGSEKNLKLWRRFVPNRVKEIECVWYYPIPSNYYVIFDKDYMFLGGYYPDDVPSGSYYKKPFLIRNSKVIDNFIIVHEETFKHYYKENQKPK